MTVYYATIQEILLHFPENLSTLPADGRLPTTHFLGGTIMRPFRRFSLITLPLLFLHPYIRSQSQQLPFSESFDNVSIPALPAGWESSSNRLSSGDFVTTHSSPLSDSNAVVSTNATIEQTLTTPLLDCSNSMPDSMSFYERRSGTHNSAVLVELSIDGGSTFPIILAETLKNPGITSYVLRTLELPRKLAGIPNARIRWHILGDGTGTTGTIRFDDVKITAKVLIDVGVLSIRFFPEKPRAGDEVIVMAAIQNTGLQSLGEISLECYLDANNDSLLQTEELVSRASSPSALSSGDSAVVSFPGYLFPGGSCRIIVTANAEGDQNPENDRVYTPLHVGFSPQTIVINEIMYDPRPGEAEYVELHNPGPEGIDISGWTITDKIDTSKKPSPFTSSGRRIAAGDFLVISNDSSSLRLFPFPEDSEKLLITRSFPGLNNDEDELILSDASGAVIDSLRYSANWHHPDLENAKGRALERINPRLRSTDPGNWSTSAGAGGGTPGRMNSIYTAALPAAATLSFEPNPFSPDGDGHEDVTILSYVLPSSTSVIRVRIYDSVGRLIRTLADVDPAGPTGRIIWDGFSESRRKARMGIYIVLLEAIDAGGTEIRQVKGTVVVATRL